MISSSDLISSSVNTASATQSSASSSSQTTTSTACLATFTINYNVIVDSNANGQVSDSQLISQTNVLNAAYAPTGLCFLQGPTVQYVNSTWFSTAGPGSQEQTDMKTTLQRGDFTCLNVYTVGFQAGLGEGLLGYSTFPVSYSGNPKDDGVVLNYQTLPNGLIDGYNLGQTLTHEVGHWFGLFHTFSNGCVDGPNGGDYIADTPAEASGASGCPVGRDSCPALPGADPIHNYLDYSADPCMSSFTPGQAQRMQQQVMTYRTKK
ncbi:hypothetical protein C8J56DRAFT_262311 [Mycena floridula]|nr:hypothetical protein C8J56DRAFT_262311 [Mycena floridula]